MREFPIVPLPPISMNKQNIKIGDVFGILTVTAFDGKPYPSHKNRKTYTCICACGEICYIMPYQLKNGNRKSCGCIGTKSPRYVYNPRYMLAMARITMYKNNARNRKLIWKLSEDVAIKLMLSTCFYCGQMNENRMSLSNRYVKFNINGIDRLMNNIGYTEVNCVPCCEICNKAKGTRTAEVFIEKIKQIHLYLNLAAPTTLLELLKSHQS